MFDPVYLPDRLSVAVTTEIAEAVRTAAAGRGLTIADYVRGSVQARLMLDGARFPRVPDLHRVTARRNSPRTV